MVHKHRALAFKVKKKNKQKGLVMSKSWVLLFESMHCWNHLFFAISCNYLGLCWVKFLEAKSL